MKRLARHLKRLWLPSLLAALVAACADDGYHYPDIRQDFLTARTDDGGYVRTVQTDDGATYDVQNSVSASDQAADTTLRIVAQYAVQSETDAPAAVLLYSATVAVSPLPLPASAFGDGVKADPASVLSIWMGLDYLNLVLEVKGTDASHAFHFVEDSVAWNPSAARREVHLSLYHDAKDDPPYYTRRAYLSVPLRQYATDGVQAVAVRFSLRNYDGELETYTFEYE